MPVKKWMYWQGKGKQVMKKETLHRLPADVAQIKAVSSCLKIRISSLCLPASNSRLQGTLLFWFVVLSRNSQVDIREEPSHPVTILAQTTWPQSPIPLWRKRTSFDTGLLSLKAKFTSRCMLLPQRPCHPRGLL